MERLQDFLDKKVQEYEQPSFIQDDPILIPHRFAKKQDIEIAGFFAAILAWGNRKSIINSCNKILQVMDQAPYDFILHHQEADLKKFEGFAHRTFNASDMYHFIDFMVLHYKTKKEVSLETAFSQYLQPADDTIENALTGFYHYFFEPLLFPHLLPRTRKHIASPHKKSACKRINMFLRWMVRSNARGVDFGLWQTIRPHQLVCPLDVHVARVARHFRLLDRNATDWEAALQLTKSLKQLDASDPVKYDFALFGLGVVEKF